MGDAKEGNKAETARVTQSRQPGRGGAEDASRQPGRGHAEDAKEGNKPMGTWEMQKCAPALHGNWTSA